MMHRSDASQTVALRQTTLFLLMAFAIASGLLIRSSFPFSLAIPVIVYLLLGQHPADVATRSRVSADRLRVSAGEEVTVTATVSLDAPVAFVRVEQALPVGVEHVSGDLYFAGRHDAGHDIELTYTIRCPRGVHLIRSPTVTVSNATLLRETSVQSPDRVRIHSVPRVHGPRRVSIRPPQVNLFPGIIPSRIAGSGTQFFDLREYRPGDSLRRVSRKSQLSSGRLARLLVTEYEEERAVDVCIILDVRRSVYEHTDTALFDAACNGAAGLAERFSSDGNRVSLLMYGGALQWAAPGYGKRRKEAILDQLAEARLQEHGAFQDLSRLPLHLLRSGTQLILVSPLHIDDTKDLHTLHARGFRVFVLRPNSLESSRRQLPDDAYTELAYRLVKLEHSRLSEELERHGILVVDWRDGLSLAECFSVNRARFDAWSRHR
ncbi:MAG: DUF58 domain-containing protein [Spirochaetaceae bacterium]